MKTIRGNFFTLQLIGSYNVKWVKNGIECHRFFHRYFFFMILIFSSFIMIKHFIFNFDEIHIELKPILLSSLWYFYFWNKPNRRDFIKFLVKKPFRPESLREMWAEPSGLGWSWIRGSIGFNGLISPLFWTRVLWVAIAP